MHRNVLLLLLLVLTLISITSARPRKYRHRGRSGSKGFGWRQKHRENRQRHHRRDSSAIDDWRDAFDPGYWSDADDRMPWLKTMFENIRRHSFNFDRFGFDFGWHTREENIPWWEGPNVCKSEKETVENTTIADNGPISRHFSMHSQVCDESETSYKCTTKSGIFLRKKTMVKVFECCHGFTRKEGMFGCPTGKLELKD